MYNNLYEIHRDTNLIDDETIISIYIEGYNSGKHIKLARGDWYNDDVLDHIHKEFIYMKVFPQENRISIEISPYYPEAQERDFSQCEDDEPLRVDDADSDLESRIPHPETMSQFLGRKLLPLR